ncbi:LXG domain-containing protein [Parageobacillus toebii]|uniref:LXG domain-containing protein n=1 Tax=Parageobacillus toebii TaxID=153151 RepID=UPI002816687E|nr:LXG domain-containing protein [Parageobacillus toebii]WMT18244.1 LXG domain-containing protein [Parageobacillus toebii]
MKLLDVQGLHEAIDEITSELHRKNAQMKNIRQSIQQFVSLEDSLKGKGGEAIRNYYEDVHITFLAYWEMFSEEFEAVLKQIKMELQTLEPAHNGFISQSFLTNELEHGLQNIKNVTAQLTDDANRIIDSVQDIVSLPRIHDDHVQHHVKEAQEYRDTVMERLWDFDQQQTAALDPIQEMIGNMYLFVQKTKSYFESTKKSIATYISPIDRKLPETNVGEPTTREDQSLYSSIAALKNTVDVSKKMRTLIKGGKTSYILYKAGKNNDLRAELERDPNGKKHYRIVATKKGFEILGIEPDAEAARELNKGLPKDGKKWNGKHILKAETNTAILKYNTKKPKASGWSKAGEAAIEKYPEIQYLTHKDARRIDKAKIVGKAAAKGAGKSLKEAVDFKSVVKSGPIKGAGKALGPISAGLSFYSNLEAAKKDKLSGEKAVVRAVQDTTIDIAVGGAVQAGSVALFTAIVPIPGVGTAIGVGFGIFANWALNNQFGKSKKSVMDRLKSWFH